MANLSGDDLLFYTRALFLIGGQPSENEACKCVIDAAKRKCQVSVELADRMIRCCLSRSNHDELFEFVGLLDDDVVMNYTCKSVSHLLDNIQVLGKYQTKIDRALKRLTNSAVISEEDRNSYAEPLQRLQGLKKYK
jgi:hypothetical protein